MTISSKIIRELGRNNLEIKIETSIMPDSIKLTFFCLDTFEGITIYGENGIKEALSDIPGIKIRIKKINENNSIPKMIRALTAKGYEVREVTA